ncbi:bucky ball [Acanthochromis polyacanthus]|uniref:bucky ball n=1 Tax=Acanthochromis polyacanthus TaxID=80966 RepID=UPI000B8F2BB9|nr:bucky ball [Acanthochromis polyacanthus]
MEAATSTMQHSVGLGPRGPNPPHGAQPAQGPSNQPSQGPSGASRPEEQHHQKPFFYIQPSQPYLPMQSLQWSVPVQMQLSYNPYYGYSGLGYGMPVMPQYQPSAYMEAPGFIVPHTHLHLMDYRRLLNPQYYQTMAFHSRRFRYQQNPPPRETASCEVQTEPLAAAQRTSTQSSGEVPSVPPVHSSDPTTVVPPPLVQKTDQSPELKDPTPSPTTRLPSNSSFVIQTEEVRIECCTAPVGLQLLQKAAEMIQHNSMLQSPVLPDDAPNLPADQSDETLQVCPDILLDGTPSTNEKTPTGEECKNQMDPVNENLESEEAASGKSEESESEKNQNFSCTVIHMPFGQKYLDKLRKMETPVWSVEENLIPSPQSGSWNVSTDSQDETLMGVADVSSPQMLIEEAPAKDIVPVIEMSSLAEDEGKEMLPTVEEMRSDADICPVMDIPVSEKARMIEVIHSAQVDVASNSPLKADRNQHRRESTIQDHQDTSFESLPAYLPSTSWLADSDHSHYCNKMPVAPKKQTRPVNSQSVDLPTRRRKLESDYKEQPNIRKSKERYKPKGKADRRSLSDHECCMKRSFNENMFSDYVSKREQLCSRCLAKQRICTSAGPVLEGKSLKRKAAPFQQWNDVLLPTCDSCKSHNKRRPMRNGSNPDVRGPHHGHDTEGESSENSCCRTRPKWRPVDDPRKLTDIKRPLVSKQNQEKCPAAIYPKLREKNCSCNELQHQPLTRERLRHCPHGNTIKEMDENCTMPVPHQEKWRNVDHVYLPPRWSSAENSWMGLMPNIDTDGCKNKTRSQHMNMHRNSQPLSQGTCRKDTRC